MLNSRNQAANYLTKIILFGWMIFLIVGCGPLTSPNTSEVPSPTENVQATEAQGVVTQMNPSETPSPASDLENLIEKAKEDLAQRLDIPLTQISLVEATDVEWSDSSLGCPQPDMFYLQVITPGYRILLEVNGIQYEYHSNRNASVIYCDNTSPPILPKP